MGSKYINPSMVSVFRECEVTVLSREEYDRRLAGPQKEKCTRCGNYHLNGGECDEHIRDNLCLDGECWYYENLAK